MNIQELLKASERDNITISVTPADLKEFAITIIEEFLKNLNHENGSVDKWTGLLNPDEVCELLKINKTTLWRWKKSGYLVPHSNIGSKCMYLKGEVYDLFNKRQVIV